MELLANVNKKFSHLFVAKKNVDVIAAKMHISFNTLFRSYLKCIWIYVERALRRQTLDFYLHALNN